MRSIEAHRAALRGGRQTRLAFQVASCAAFATGATSVRPLWITMTPDDNRVQRAAPAPQSPPAGWYADPQGPGLRWWDGGQWTSMSRPRHPSFLSRRLTLIMIERGFSAAGR